MGEHAAGCPCRAFELWLTDVGCACALELDTEEPYNMKVEIEILCAT